jgi:hypothetical protein
VGVIVTVMVAVWPGCSGSGVNGGGLGWTEASQMSPVVVVMVGSKARQCPMVMKSAVEGGSPPGGNGPTRDASAIYGPGVSWVADTEATAGRVPADRPIRNGDRLLANSSASMGTGAVAVVVTRLHSVGTR